VGGERGLPPPRLKQRPTIWYVRKNLFTLGCGPSSPAPKHPLSSAKDKSTTLELRWEEGGGSGEEKADGNSLLISGDEWVRGEIRRDRE